MLPYSVHEILSASEDSSADMFIKAAPIPWKIISTLFTLSCSNADKPPNSYIPEKLQTQKSYQHQQLINVEDIEIN